MHKTVVLISITLSLFSCRSEKNLPTVGELNINQYTGKWFEIARLPNRFEKGLDCVSATYSIKEDGNIEVFNQGRKFAKSNQISKITGKAWMPNTNYPGRLKVQFFWPFAGNYYVIYLNDNYTLALVGDPSRKFLWVLSKNKIVSDSDYSRLITIAKNNEFTVGNVIKINQDCQ